MIDCYTRFDDAYEDFASSLRMIGFDWQQAHAQGIEGHCTILSDRRSESQMCFSLEPNQRMANGQRAIEFGVLAGIFQGIQGTLIQVSALTGGRNWHMLGFHCVDNKIYFQIIPIGQAREAA